MLTNYKLVLQENNNLKNNREKHKENNKVNNHQNNNKNQQQKVKKKSLQKNNRKHKMKIRKQNLNKHKRKKKQKKQLRNKLMKTDLNLSYSIHLNIDIITHFGENDKIFISEMDQACSLQRNVITICCSPQASQLYFVNLSLNLLSYFIKNKCYTSIT